MHASVFNPNATRNLVMSNLPNQQAQPQNQQQNRNQNGGAAQTFATGPPPPPLTTGSPTSPTNPSFHQQQQQSSPHSKGPSSVFVLSSPPRRVPLVYLSEPWSSAVFSLAAICHSEAGCLSETTELLCCNRCHLMGQLEALRNVPKPDEIDEYERRGWRIPPNPRPNPACFLPFLCCVDVLTGGNPIGGLGWSGCGSTLWGCHIRTRLRKKYRIQGSGMDDLCYSACCAGFAVMQQEREMLNQDSPYDVPCGGSFCSINERMVRRRRNLEENNQMI